MAAQIREAGLATLRENGASGRIAAASFAWLIWVFLDGDRDYIFVHVKNT
jgi:hypothetical protein